MMRFGRGTNSTDWRLLWLGPLLALGWPSPAHSKVELAFYSRDAGGTTFPHAFVTLHGTIDATGERVDGALGFTAHTITPALLLGAVPGEVIAESSWTLSKGSREFALSLSDDRYRAVDAAIRRWKALRQPSYDYDHRNCVHFVRDLARAAGLRVPHDANLMKQPHLFLATVKTANAGLFDRGKDPIGVPSKASSRTNGARQFSTMAIK